jgi:hypothetical protein
LRFPVLFPWQLFEDIQQHVLGPQFTWKAPRGLS